MCSSDLLPNHGSDVLLCDGERKTAQTVIATELQHNDLRLVSEDAVDPFEAVLSGVAADAFVNDSVVVSGGVEQLLQIGRVVCCRIDAETGGETVTEAGDDRARVG